ncbi:MAG: hypothetical protein ACI83P_001171 [Janthinobacterium sp.]|jgi:hypothetical protein
MTMQKQTLRPPSHAPAPPGFRLERWQRHALYACIAALTASGLLWLGAHYFMRPVTEFGESVSPFEPWAMKLHGAAAMALPFLLGTMLNSHIRRALRAARNTASGWTMVAALALLVASGYCLYYVAGETTRPVWSLTHWIVGIGFATGLPLHIALGRKATTSQKSERTITEANAGTGSDTLKHSRANGARLDE